MKINESELFESVFNTWGEDVIDCVIEAYCRLYIDTECDRYMIIANELMKNKIKSILIALGEPEIEECNLRKKIGENKMHR